MATNCRGKRQFRELALKEIIKLDLGSGPKYGRDGWTTIDSFGSDIVWDLTDKIPLPNSSVTEIYTSHLLEHLDFNQITNLLEEIERLLKVGGKLRICVPDASKYIHAYMAGYLLRDPNDCYPPALTITNSLIDQVNYIAYMGGEHKFMFDSQNLRNLLLQANFNSVKERCIELDVDSLDREVDSIYFIAIK